MKLKSAKMVFFSILFILFGLGHVSEALNYSNSIDIHNETSELISKEGGDKKKGDKKKVNKKKVNKKKVDKEKQINLNKVQSNNEAMREEAKERYKKWKENKKAKKSNLDLDSN